MHRFLAAIWMAGVATTLAASPHAGPSAEQLQFFETRIRPVLSDRCYRCHSAQSETLKAGLHLDSREGILKGGESGPAAVPGDPQSSLLIRAISYDDKDLRMPPRTGKLPDAQIADLTAWVRMGVPWPAETKLASIPAQRQLSINDSDRAYWAFQPIVRPAEPGVTHRAWASNPIDRFVLAELESKGLVPNPPATKRELMRRVYFDLLGLPPTPSEVTEFLNDTAPGAYERLVDRLLSRPEYGERWARHWLDIVRYAQSNGYERDGEKPFAWRYRDYVIRAFNEDKPFDRFILEQIAGDELPDGSVDSVIATGFQRLGVWDDEPDDALMAEYDGLDDIVSTTGTAFLGLTLGCARCHDHKFDPIPQSDYYQILAFFRNVRPNADARYSLDSANYLPLATPSAVRDWISWHEQKIQSLESQIACALEGPAKVALQRQLDQVWKEPPPFQWTLGVRERGAKPLPTHVLIRGNPKSLGPEVEPAFLTVLGGEKPNLHSPSSGALSTGRRLALARWIASPKNPLTARVAVNRIWQHHFGQGLVKTAGDFGRAGTPPTNPKLLDWLASEFIDSGWSLKRMHRLILLSSTYRMSSRNENEKAMAADPDDELLWRQRLRRLEAEAVRDSMLAVSGELNPQMGGRGFFPKLAGEVLAGESRPGLDWEISSPAEEARRSIYIYVRRTLLVPLLEAFDYNNTSSPLPERPVTTVAPQALMLLNGDWAQQRAEAFAKRLSREGGANVRDRINRAYRIAFARSPSSQETELALNFLRQQDRNAQAVRSRLTFRLDVPNSLFDEYMKQLKPADFLRGPREQWSYHRGRWSGAYEGIRSMDRQHGPFALWTGHAFADGTVQATLLLPRGSEAAALLLRGSAEKDELRGYEINLDPRRQRVSFRHHAKDVQTIAEKPAPIPTDSPLFVRVALSAGHVRVWLATRSTTPTQQASSDVSSLAGQSIDPPILDATDPTPRSVSGFFGIRCLGAALSLDGLSIIDDKTQRELFAVEPTPVGPEQATAGALEAGGSWGEEHAWRSFCLLLLNLNEFVYVD
jgi:hypothetical protein